MAWAPSPICLIGDTVMVKRFSGCAEIMACRASLISLTFSILRVNSAAGRLRQLATGWPSWYHTNAVPKVMITRVACIHASRARASSSFACCRNSSCVLRAKDVWCRKEQMRPAPAPISTQSAASNGSPESSLRTASSMERGLYSVPKGLMQVLKPAAVSLAPMLSAKQLPSSTILSDSLKGCCAESAMTGVMSFIIGAKILNLLTV